MVDVGGKDITTRQAVAEGELHVEPRIRDLLFDGQLPKGDALAAARLAGIMAAKRTPELIPLCHAIQLGSIEVDILPAADARIVTCTATVSATDRTGAEMEALTAVSVALLTLYDMLKAVQKDIRIQNVRLRRKSGGRSGEIHLA